MQLGAGLPVAVEKVEISLGMRAEPTVEERIEAAVERIPSPADNEASMRALTAMMAGLG